MRRLLHVPLTFALTSAVLLAGCAQDEPTAASTDGDVTSNADLTALRVGTVSIVSALPLAVAEREGIFEKHGLDVEITPGQNFGAVLPLIQNGELDVGFAASVPLLNSSAGGSDVRAFAVANHTDTDSESANTAVMVMPGSGISSPKDLEGRRVGIAARGSTDDLVLRAAIAADGGDPTQVSILELGVGPPLLQGLTRGNVDAVVGGEPTRSLGLAAGAETAFEPHVIGMPGVPLGAYFTTESYASDNEEVLRAFTRSLEEASEFARENPDVARALAPEFLNIPETLAAEIRLPSWDTDFNRAGWQTLVDTGVQLDVVNDNADLDKVLLQVD